MTATSLTTGPRIIALTGNPNSGKSTLFNALTGMRQRVGNYPGVTVEKKVGRMLLPDGYEVSVLDLPGTYSLNPASPDESMAVDVLLGRTDHTPPPDIVICVVDAGNLERNLFLVSQIIDRHLAVVVALNMIDSAEEAGISIDVSALQRELGVPVVPTIACKATGIEQLKKALSTARNAPDRSFQWRLPGPVQERYDELVGQLRSIQGEDSPTAVHDAAALLSAPTIADLEDHRFPPELLAHVQRDHEKLDFLGFDRQSVFIQSRYDWIRAVCGKAVLQEYRQGPTPSDRADRILTHRVWGYVIFLGLMALMFQAIFTWAAWPMRLIVSAFDSAGHLVASVLPPGDLRDLLVHGALAGVAAVVTFLPQIVFLFLFLGLLEDSGYMARAAFILDRLMRKVGLHGKSFIPLLSSFACAVPGIMATRTIENPRDRLVTMLVAPLVSCSARLPVYTLLIAAFIPPTVIFGLVSLPALTLFALYVLGLAAALTTAWVLKRTLLRGPAPVFIMELPSYRIPSVRSVLLQVRVRALQFLERAGTIILGVSILLWFLASYPKLDGAPPSAQLQHSFAGRAGHMLEPLIRPLGFDWKVGIGLVGSVLQREVFVSTLGTLYNIQDAGEGTGSVSLQEELRHDVDRETGRPAFTALTAVCLLVYYVLAMQCLSTVAVMRKETGGWRWPLFQIAYMTVLAYGATFIVYRAGLALGMGG